ncbi:MAG: hypothetical protein HYR84_13075 [Planctomycetes bacterium]|nr:hypothetical protein [Planctomycetota bacterium]
MSYIGGFETWSKRLARPGQVGGLPYSVAGPYFIPEHKFGQRQIARGSRALAVFSQGKREPDK